MSEEKHPDENMDDLSKAIVDAIMNSRDVRKAIRKLSEMDDNYAKSFMVLMLKVQNLTDTMEDPQGTTRRSAEFTIDPGQLLEKKPKRTRRDVTNRIDGKVETPNEIAFREYLASLFDQDEWLKNNGLIF